MGTVIHPFIFSNSIFTGNLYKESIALNEVPTHLQLARVITFT